MEAIKIYKVKLVKEKSNLKYDTTVSSPKDAATIIKEYLKGKDREHFIVLCLNIKNNITAIHTVSIGSLNNSIVPPANVLKVALLSNSAGIIVAHNHPSGQTSPSSEDIKVTKRLKEASKLMGIDLLDHIIVGLSSQDKVYSFRENNDL